jgi:hypothetical protein
MQAAQWSARKVIGATYAGHRGPAGLSGGMRAQLNGREAAYDRRASCSCYAETARPPEGFRANCSRDENT